MAEEKAIDTNTTRINYGSENADIFTQYSGIVGLPQRIGFFTIYNPATDGTFDPVVVNLAGDIATWRFEDNSSIVGNSISTIGNGLNGTKQIVKIDMAASLSNVQQIDITNDKVIDVLDLSSLTGLSRCRVGSDNIDMTDLILPMGTTISQMFATSSGLTIPDFGNVIAKGDWQMQFSPFLKSVGNIAGNSLNLQNRFSIQDCALDGNLDFSSHGGFGGKFQFSNNVNVPEILLPIGGIGVFTEFTGSNSGCKIVNFRDMPNATNHNGLIVSFSSNGISQPQIDTILSDLVFINSGAFIGRTLILTGAGNSAPGVAGLIDALTLASSGWTVFVNP